MTDDQMARAIHGAGLLPAETIQEAGRARLRGESLAKAILRLGLLPPGDILQFDPEALSELTPPTARPAASSPSMGLGAEGPRDIEGDFYIISGSEQENNNYDPAEAPVVRWANELLKLAIQMGSSDVHLEPRPTGLLPRYRVDGSLRSGQELPVDLTQPIISRFKVLANLDITESRMPQDGRFRARYGTRTFDFRVSTLPGIHGEKVVLRLLDHSSLVTDLQKLGFSQRDKVQFESMLERSHGMILVTGPTGSGKTTTLYAALACTQDDEKNIITIEDPVEYELAGVNQSNVQSDIGFTFASALRAILRQDPDVILVGEIRDEETADVAVRAALTGHLLLSTLHTNSAVATITRLQDMNVPSYLIASSLTGVLAQRLARMNCRYCREEIPQSDVRRDEWSQFFDLPHNAPMHIGKGCEKCNGTGRRGRVALVEILDVGPKLRKAIMGGQEASSLRQAAKEEGLRTLRDDARDKILAGILSPEEGMSVLMGHEE
jgi:type IV pilus assembly protein PilB